MPAWLAPSLFVAALGLVGWGGKRVLDRLDRIVERLDGLVERVAVHESRLAHVEREIER